MKKLALIFAAALGTATFASSPANANPAQCLIDYFDDVAGCGNNSSCIANAGGVYLLCLETQEAPAPW